MTLRLWPVVRTLLSTDSYSSQHLPTIYYLPLTDAHTGVRKVELVVSTLERGKQTPASSLPAAVRGRTAENCLQNGQCQSFPSLSMPGISPMERWILFPLRLNLGWPYVLF